MSPDIPTLEVSGLSVRYGPKLALKEVSITVSDGEVVTLLGANGAGKTTLLMTLSGFRPLASGAISYKGRSLVGVIPSSISRLGVIQVPEGRRVLPGMTVRENLALGAECARHGGRVPGNLDRILERFPVIERKLNSKAGLLSGGEQQMLVIGRALMASPRLLLLDEPSLGLAPIVIQEVYSALRDIKQEGVTMLLVEQNVKVGLGLADRAYVLETGSVVKEGSAQELLGDPEIQAAYLGGSV
ncbi:MAG: ABC transporter ATP-binding protein [Mycobacteriales bacterium]